MATLEEIEKVLDEKVRPHLQEHGGELKSLSFEAGTYRFQFLGHCSGCPSAYLTTEEVVAEELKGAIPEIKEVILVQQVSEDLLAEARALMGRNHS
ncbi:MAG: NifU family protein [Pseudoflavonifractor sp.]|nr:NifU family protein [Pseudoflavonifractor sp.]